MESRIYKNSGKKIAILTPTYSQFSGIDRVVELQAKKLSKKNKVSIFALDSKIKTKGIDVVKIGMPKNSSLERIYRLFFFLDRSKIKETAKKLKYFDVVISHFYPMNLIASYAKKRYGVEYVYHNHGVAFPSLFKNPLERMYMGLFNIFSNLSVKNVSWAVSISDFLRKELKKETGIDSVVEYDPIDEERFMKGLSGKSIRKKFNLKDFPVLLYVGRISPHKGIHLLLESFKLIRKEFPKAHLIIVGKPTFDSYFKKLKKIETENVIYAGFVEDKMLPYYYAACDVYTTATLWEGFNMTVVEAQKMGKPVVAFDICAHPEVVKKGILVKEKDTNGFADAVIKLLNKYINKRI